MLFGLYFEKTNFFARYGYILHVLSILFITKVVSEPSEADLHVVDERNVVSSSLVSRGPASTYLRGQYHEIFRAMLVI
jgi:uncharacterized protein YccT (UPF0319 family)